jgi:hypothetical protein
VDSEGTRTWKLNQTSRDPPTVSPQRGRSTGNQQSRRNREGDQQLDGCTPHFISPPKWTTEPLTNIAETGQNMLNSEDAKLT